MNIDMMITFLNSIYINLKWIASLLFIPFLFVNLLAAKTTDDHDRLAIDFYNKSSSIFLSHHSNKFYEARLSRFKNSFSPEALHAHYKIVESMLYWKNQDQDHTEYINLIKQKLSNSELQTVLKWLNSPTGSKINQLTKENMLKTSDIHFFKEQIESPGNPLTQKRKRLFQEMEDALQVTKMILDIMDNRSRFLNKVFYSDENRPIIERRANEVREGIKWEHIHDQHLSRRLYAFRECTDDEIEEYVRFLNSKVGQKMTAVIHEVVLKKSSPKKKPIVIKPFELSSIAEKSNKRLPKMFGSNMRLDLVAVKEKALVYHYTLFNPPENSADLKRLRKNLRKTWDESVCRDEVMVYYPYSGITLQHLYFDEKKRLVLEMNITPRTCGLVK